MKQWKQILCLLIILCLCASLGTAVLAADASTASKDVPADYGKLQESVSDTLLNWKAGQRFQIPSEWKDKLKSFDYAALGEDLKTILETSKDLSDEELYDTISRMADDRGIPLMDSQIRQLCDLCRNLEKLNSDEIKERLEELMPGTDDLPQDDTDESAEEPSVAKKKGSGVLRFLQNAASKAVSLIRGFLDRIKKKL